MSKGKNIKRPLASYESVGKVSRGGKYVNDTYSRITDSLLLSDAFQDLPPHIQILYISMRQQDMGKRKPNRDYDEKSPLWDKVKSDLCFYYPSHTAKKYHNRYRLKSSRLYDDIEILIYHGFIEKVINGKNAREKNVYKYSDKWQEWKCNPP